MSKLLSTTYINFVHLSLSLLEANAFEGETEEVLALVRRQFIFRLRKYLFCRILVMVNQFRLFLTHFPSFYACAFFRRQRFELVPWAIPTATSLLVCLLAKNGQHFLYETRYKTEENKKRIFYYDFWLTQKFPSTFKLGILTSKT